jgi:hypothetical protein
MSLASLLLAFAPALAARFRPEKDETQARIAGLEIDLADARRDADEWRQRCEDLEIHMLREFERLMRREAWAREAAPNPLARPWQQQEAVAEQYRYQQAVQSLMAQQMQAQAWQNQQQAYQNQALAQNQQLAQYQQGVFDNLPNCTPSRGDVLTGRLNHP